MATRLEGEAQSAAHSLLGHLREQKPRLITALEQELIVGNVEAIRAAWKRLKDHL